MPGANEQENQNQQTPGANDGDKGDQGNKGEQKPPAKEGEGSEGEGGQVDIAKLDPKVQKLIKDLRSENAQHRNQNKNLGGQLGKLKGALIEAGIIEDDSEEPEEKIKTLTAKTSSLEFRSAILESALEHGIAKDGLEYFEFLVSKRANELDEGAELTDEMLGELAAQVKKQTSGGSSGARSTSVGGGTGGANNPPPPGDAGGVSLEQFVKMNITEKSLMYQKQPEVYARLVKEAKEKKLLI